jgi:hypothetical protein
MLRYTLKRWIGFQCRKVGNVKSGFGRNSSDNRAREVKNIGFTDFRKNKQDNLTKMYQDELRKSGYAFLEMRFFIQLLSTDSFAKSSSEYLGNASIKLRVISTLPINSHIYSYTPTQNN